MTCPKSEITAWSLSMLERFCYWKAGLDTSLMQSDAKTADALMFLNELWVEEERDEQVKE